MRFLSMFMRDLLSPNLADRAAAFTAPRAQKVVDLADRALNERSNLAPVDDAAPTSARTWTLETVRTSSGSPEIVVRLIGDAGRSYRVALSPSLAAGLCGALGHALAETFNVTPRPAPGMTVRREDR
ncbi:hypothetical protein MMSR116_05970 [Methylobacterium mesophilicum SR1.6/6]|uniref:Uncharacterized protein n=1 Tax=Methylobacterium mesophilicum SR1.6/6 TaxID=908290 RepID=A0A6B9FEQ9_9HYPH|nr:hypothetical protein [Methylobacterium mesophilicum]QGY01500.1 hypothetical protein MMSR116_05970 [Methylobacterium mesophilicum SR1.6/6]